MKWGLSLAINFASPGKEVEEKGEEEKEEGEKDNF